MTIHPVVSHNTIKELEVRILLVAFADEWNGIPRKSHDLEIVGSTPASAISEFHGSQKHPSCTRPMYSKMPFCFRLVLIPISVK